jgi:hypothetical protein
MPDSSSNCADPIVPAVSTTSRRQAARHTWAPTRYCTPVQRPFLISTRCTSVSVSTVRFGAVQCRGEVGVSRTLPPAVDDVHVRPAEALLWSAADVGRNRAPEAGRRGQARLRHRKTARPENKLYPFAQPEEIRVFQSSKSPMPTAENSRGGVQLVLAGSPAGARMDDLRGVRLRRWHRSQLHGIGREGRRGRLCRSRWTR